VSGDSLSTFASEHESASGKGRPTGAESPGLGPTRGTTTSRFAIASLALLALVQMGLIGWWYVSGGQWPAATTTGTLSITSDPPGGTVTIDGDARGVTPVTLTLAGGAHELRVSLGGPADWSRSIEVTAGSALDVYVVQALPPASASAGADSGTLEITTEPAGLAVSVDDKPAGISPVSVTGLDPGAHEVAVTRGTSIVRRTVSVEAGVPTAVLISTAASGIPSGWVTVSGPVPVQILEGGTLLGSSDTPRLLLTVGRHDLEFVNGTFGYRTTRTVQVTAGQATSVALDPASGTLSVNAQPWGEVWIDGQRIGETPIGNLPLPIGNHELLIRHPQLGERRRTVAVSANTPARVGIDLRQ
jgi:PEGA domain